MNGLSINTMANTINKDKIIALSTVNNSDKCNVNILITENYCTKFTIMSFLVSALQFPATNSILKKSLDLPLVLIQVTMNNR